MAIITSLPNGIHTQLLYEMYQKALENFPKTEWSKLKYHEGSLTSFNNINQGIINYLLKDSATRIAVPRDNVNGDLYSALINKDYTDVKANIVSYLASKNVDDNAKLNANIVHEKQPSYKKNKGLWKKIIELAEEKQGKPKFPFMIQGFYTLPDKTEKEYGIKIIPAPNFEIIEDERFSGKYNKRQFNNLNKNGVPIFEKKGNFTFYTRNDGLSGVTLSKDGSLDASLGDLAFVWAAGWHERVIFVDDAERVALNNFENNFDALKAVNKRVQDLLKDQRYNPAGNPSWSTD